MPKPEYDRKDWEIMRLLRDNARMTTTDIANRVGLSKQAVSERIKRLKDEKGIIRRFIADIDPLKVGLTTAAITFIEIDPKYDIDEIATELSKIGGVESIWFTATEKWWLAMLLRCKDNEEYTQKSVIISQTKGVKSHYGVILTKEWMPPKPIEPPEP